MLKTNTNQQQIRLPGSRWVCSGCGKKASCDCGLPFVPPGERAARAVAVSPRMSDRAIAKQEGVSHTTVQKMCKATGNQLPVEKRGTDVLGLTDRQT